MHAPQSVATTGRSDGRRRGEIVIRTERCRAVRIIWILRAAAERPRVVRDELAEPLDAAALDVEGEDGVGHRLRGIGVAVTSANIDRTTAYVDRGRRPAGADGPVPLWLARRVHPARSSFADRVGLPDYVPRADIERGDAAAK